MPEPVVRSIPLSQLELSPANVRKTSAGETAFAELKTSIAAHSLLENLVAGCLGPGEDGVGRYAVIAGGRRLTALLDLAREGLLAPDYPVLCRMVDNASRESELSLAENVVRVAMHPADQVQQPVDERVVQPVSGLSVMTHAMACGSLADVIQNRRMAVLEAPSPGDCARKKPQPLATASFGVPAPTRRRINSPRLCPATWIR